MWAIHRIFLQVPESFVFLVTWEIVFIWSCFVSCLLFLLFYVSLRNLYSGAHRGIRFEYVSNNIACTLFLFPENYSNETKKSRKK